MQDSFYAYREFAQLSLAENFLLGNDLRIEVRLHEVQVEIL